MGSDSISYIQVHSVRMELNCRVSGQCSQRNEELCYGWKIAVSGVRSELLHESIEETILN